MPHTVMMKLTLILVLFCAIFIYVSAFSLLSEMIGSSWNFRDRNARRTRRDVENDNLIYYDDANRIIHNPINDIIPCFCGAASWMQKFSNKNEAIAAKCMENYVSIWDPTNEADLNEYGFYEAMRKVTVCSTECIFQEGNLLLSDGNLNKTRTKEYFMNNIFIDEWADVDGIAGDAIDTCLATGAEKYEKVKHILLCGTENAVCNPSAFSFLFVCLLMEIEVNCLYSMITEDAACDDFLTNLQNDTFLDYQTLMYCLDSNAENLK